MRTLRPRAPRLSDLGPAASSRGSIGPTLSATEGSMAKDKRVGELPGITASATEGLNRIGVVTLLDLLAADFDRVAYIVDDYNEAARLLREAKKIADAGSGRRGARSAHIDPTVPSPLSPS